MIVPRIPEHERYLEPFFGGGSVYFDAISADYCFANDINSDLMNFYSHVKSQHERFFLELYEWIEQWERFPLSGREVMYYEVRDRYNSNSSSKVIRAIDFFLLRELAYGGMFRVNSNGKFNVPFGKSYGRNTDILRNKVDHLRSELVIAKMQKINLHSFDFQQFINSERGEGQKEFMFVDPPYDSVFSKYGHNDFNTVDQRRLADCLKSYSGHFMLVVKATPLIEELYFYCDQLHVEFYDLRYKFNIKGRFSRNSRHALITNYEPAL